MSAKEAVDYASGALLQTVTERSQTPSLDGDGSVSLARGGERGPDLGHLSIAPVAVLTPHAGAAQVELGQAVDYASLAAQAQATDVAKRQADAAASAAASAAALAFAKEQRRQLDHVAGQVRFQATADFASIASLVSSPTEAGKPVLEAYVSQYGGAKVTVGTTTQAVPVPELEKVQAALALLSGSQVSGSQGQSGRLGYAMVRVPAGSFEMGSPSSEEGRYDDEDQHTVRISRAFWLGKTEVTQGLWEDVMGSNPSNFSSCGPDCPVESVSWVAAAKFANALSSKEGLAECYRVSGDTVSWPQGLSCPGYRLPTESEWEYAGRAGEGTVYAGGNNLDAVAWTGSNSGDKTHPVAQKQPNAWGLVDMSGNVWERTWDIYGDYVSSSPTDPTGANTGAYRVFRGGSCHFFPRYARLASLSWSTPGYRNNNLGLRLARSNP